MCGENPQAVPFAQKQEELQSNKAQKKKITLPLKKKPHKKNASPREKIII